MKNHVLVFAVIVVQTAVAYAQNQTPLAVEKDAAKIVTPNASRIVEVADPPKSPTHTQGSPAKSQSATRIAPSRPAVRKKSQPNTYAVAASRLLTLYVGEVRVIDRPNVVRVAVGNGQVLSATVINEKQVVLLGDASGETILYFWLKDGSQLAYDISVTADHTTKVAQEVRRLLGVDSGVQVRLEGRDILLEGADVSVDTATRIEAVMKRYPQLINLVPARKVKVRDSAEQMIYLDVKVVEVRKKAADKLGIKWDAAAGGPTAATSGYFYANSPFRGVSETAFPATSAVRPFVSYFGFASQIASSLNFLEQSGDVWTLAEPRLSCKTGGKARSQVGGEIPIQVANGLGTNAIVYKPYGVILEFEPVSDDQGQVSSKITIEVSQPDTRNSSAGATAFTQNRTETHVALKDGETLVLAGLLSERGQKSRDVVPGLSKLPLLGALFKNNEYDNDQTEVVVMVTPRIAEANSRMKQGDVSNSNSILNKSMTKEGIEKIESINEFIKKRLAD